MEFIWDETKREKVLAEHKIDFAKIEDIFDDSFAVFIEDFKQFVGQGIAVECDRAIGKLRIDVCGFYI